MKNVAILILLLITNVFAGYGQETNRQKTSSIEEGNVQGQYVQKVIVGGGSKSQKGSPSPRKKIKACIVQDFNHEKVSDRFGVLTERTEIYPGNILTGTNFINGNYTEVDKAINPIKLFMTGIIFENDNDQIVTISNPSISSIHTAIPRLIKKPKLGDAQSNFYFETSDVFSSADVQFNMNIHTDAFFGLDISNKLAISTNKNSTVIMVSFVQKYFTIVADLPKDKTKLFKDSSIPDDDMCYIKSVAYGRKGILLISLTNLSESIRDSLEAHKSGIASLGNQMDLNANFFKGKIFKSSNITGYFYGGSSKGVAKVVSEKDPEKTVDAFYKLMEEGADFSVTNYGKPIEYEVAHLKTGQTLSMEYKINQKMTICEEGDKYLKITLKSMKAEKMQDGKTDREGEIYGLVAVHMSNGKNPLNCPSLFQGGVMKEGSFDTEATANSSKRYRYIYPCSGGQKPFKASNPSQNRLFSRRSGSFAMKLKEGETKSIGTNVTYLINKDDFLNTITFFADLNEFDSDDENEWLDAGFEEKIEKTLSALMKGGNRSIQTQRIFKDGCSVLITYEVELLDNL